MRCSFCATGKGGFARNLQPHEIVDQVLTVQEAFGKRVSNVVFMVGVQEAFGKRMCNVVFMASALRARLGSWKHCSVYRFVHAGFVYEVPAMHSATVEGICAGSVKARCKCCPCGIRCRSMCVRRMHVRHVEKFILQCLLPIRNTKGLHSGPRCSSSTPEQALREPPSLRTFVLA